MQLIQINKTTLFLGMMAMLLSACGGGGGGGAASQATVSAITSQSLYIGKTGQILIHGQSLNASVQATLTGCTSSKRLSVQPSQIRYECVINTGTDNTGKTINVTVKRADGQELKTQQFMVALPDIRVDRIELLSAPLVYSSEITPPSQPVRFKIYGKNLDAGVLVLVSCSSLTTVTSAESEREYTCDLKDTTDYDGQLTVSPRNSAGAHVDSELNIPISYPAPTPSVTAFTTSDTIRYGAKARFNVTGENLSGLIKLSDCTTSTVVSVSVDKKSAAIDCEFSATKDKTVFTLQVQRKDGMVLLATTQDFTPPKPRVAITSTGVAGTVTVELEPSKAPITVNNFLKYVTSGFYTNLIFHRVVKSGIFINQGGGYTKGTTSLSAKTNGLFSPIALESTNMTGLSNTRGTIAMARTNEKDSATSQFYFNVQTNTSFDYVSADIQPGYAVFGAIVSGDMNSFSTMDAINAVTTSTFGGFENVPDNNVTITSVVQTQ